MADTPNQHGLVPVDFDPFATPQPETLPLTEQQREMYAVTLMGDDANSAYNQCLVLRLRGSVSAESLRRALIQVVQRHEALRLRIDGNTESQEILPVIDVELPVVDLSDLSLEQRERKIREILDGETRRPFDLSTTPLWRAQLIRETTGLHRFVFTAHHIVADGWSSAVIFGDLASTYSADRFGVAARLPPAASYRQFVANGFSDSVLAESRAAEDYWAAKFGGTVPAFELPFDHPRPTIKTYSAAREVLTIDNTLYQAVRKMGVQQGATLFVTLLAAFEVLIARLSGSEDMVIGVPMASQAMEENGHLVAHGVNTVPLLCRVDMRLSFSEHLRVVRQTFLDAQAHQRLTFGSLVQRLRLPRDPSRTPLVSVIFNIDKLGAPFDFGEVKLEGIETPKSFHNFEFGINAVDDGKTLLLECDYNSDLLKPQTVARWLGYYRELLTAVAANPTMLVVELPLLSAAERTELVGGSGELPTYVIGESLHEGFEQQTARTPNAIALIEDESRTSLSYAELNHRANALAHRLRELGVAPNQLVGLRTERNAQLVIGILAILKAGGAYLPLDPIYPLDRISFMLQDAGVGVVLTQLSLKSELVSLNIKLLCVDEPAGISNEQNLPSASGQTDLAYVIYTSGSTGKPKGVRITHRNVLRLMAATDAWFGFNERDVWTLFHSYAFDFSVWELWGALLYGGRVVVVPVATSRNVEAFRELLLREKVTVLNQTPTAFRQFIATDIALPPVKFALRYVIFGGEALELKSLEPWFERHGDKAPRLINMYGITETTVHVTYRPITLVDLATNAGSIIGVPIPDLRFYLLDAHQQPVPLGVPGEIYVSGAGIAPGYLNRPELTAQRFLPDPFHPGSRMYRSGDLARRLDSGEIEYLGRIDSQVMVRGFRIELGEIETVIAKHPDVRQVVVIDREDTPGEKRLAAYLVTQEQRPELVDELRERLRAALPDYMTPAHFIFVDAIKLTPNGKLDRKALPAPAQSTGEQRHEPMPPRTVSERLVVSVFSQVLNRSDVGVKDNFFHLGGHSLMAARVMARLRASANIDLPLRNLFERPTPEGLAAAIDALSWTAGTGRAPTNQKGERAGDREEIEL